MQKDNFSDGSYMYSAPFFLYCSCLLHMLQVKFDFRLNLIFHCSFLQLYANIG